MVEFCEVIENQISTYLLRENSVQNFGLEGWWSCWQPISRSSRARADCLRLRDSIPLPHFPLSPFSDRFSPLIGYRQVRTRTETPPRSRPHFENCWTDRLSSHWISNLRPGTDSFSLGREIVGKCKIEFSNPMIWQEFSMYSSISSVEKIPEIGKNMKSIK